MPALPGRLAGFPAHAGMDPVYPSRRRSSPGLPRTRGDGPATFPMVGGAHTASPHTRGWTAPRQRLPGRSCGFPAHAGMDPRRSCAWPAGCRLPRTRGDGPQPSQLCTRAMRASPHTRGWTPADALLVLPRRGFPAHAGMDPAGPSRRTFGSRLPRTRGDGPLSRIGLLLAQTASPHTRGWTRPGRRLLLADLGFPAHAGMDPLTCSYVSGPGRLPRTRGDGPVRAGQFVVPRGASPHTRGWTLL